MKSRSEIWLAALSELGEQCSVSTQRDAETMVSRVAAEGDSFLKVTLPQFAKDFEQSLAYGAIPSWAFHGWSQRPFYLDVVKDEGPREVRKMSHGIPKFLGGFMGLLFTSDVTVHESLLRIYSEGQDLRVLRPQLITRSEWVTVGRQADAVAAIRQLCLMFGKEKELCSPSKTEAAYASFIETDKELTAPLPTGGPTPSSEEVCSLMFGGASVSYSELPSVSSMEQSTEEH